MLRPFAPSALHIRQSPGANPRHFSELLQRQTRRTTMTAQHLPETQMSSDETTPLPAGRHSTRHNRAAAYTVVRRVCSICCRTAELQSPTSALNSGARRKAWSCGLRSIPDDYLWLELEDSGGRIPRLAFGRG